MTSKTNSPWFRLGTVAVIGVVLLALQSVRQQDFSVEELAILITLLVGAAGVEWGWAKFRGKR